MLTKRQNLLETIRGGKPVVNQWGVTISFPEDNIPQLIKEYGGKLTFMGGIDSGKIDRPDWTRENIAAVAEEACRECGTKFFIPCNTMGGPESIYPGVYETLSEEIARISKQYF